MHPSPSPYLSPSPFLLHSSPHITSQFAFFIPRRLQAMGVVVSKCEGRRIHQRARELRARVASLEEEVKEALRAREACEQHVSAFSRKEEEWRRERRRHREEAARLRARLAEEEQRARSLEAASGLRGDSMLMEQMKAEQARREETVDKWKQLYLAIKAELDDLIQRTRQGERYCWGTEQGIISGLQKEMRAKEEATEELRLKVAAMERDAVRREREIDILRQSLRILSLNRRSRARKTLPKGLRT